MAKEESKKMGVFGKLKKAVKTSVGKSKDKFGVMKKKGAILKIKLEKRPAINKLTDECNQRTMDLIDEFLRRFNYYQIQALARIYRIPDMKTITVRGRRGDYEKRVRNEFEDYVKLILEKIRKEKSTKKIFEFAEKNGIRDTFEFSEELNKIREEYKEKEKEIEEIYSEKIRQVTGEEVPKIEKVEKNDDKKDLFNHIVEEIKAFEPPEANQRFEIDYQLMLFGWLKRTFPEVKVEQQRGSSRPDLNVGDIGIEIKGPTNYGDLQTIADKLLRYPKYFKGGIIIVLFHVKVYERFYKDWVERIENQYPNIVIIRR